MSETIDPDNYPALTERAFEMLEGLIRDRWIAETPPYSSILHCWHLPWERSILTVELEEYPSGAWGFKRAQRGPSVQEAYELSRFLHGETFTGTQGPKVELSRDTKCAGCGHPRYTHEEDETKMPCGGRDPIPWEDLPYPDQYGFMDCYCYGWWEPGTKCPYDFEDPAPEPEPESRTLVPDPPDEYPTTDQPWLRLSAIPDSVTTIRDAKGYRLIRKIPGQGPYVGRRWMYDSGPDRGKYALWSNPPYTSLQVTTDQEDEKS